MLAEALQSRRSIRRYSRRQVPDELLHEIVGLACQAPSSTDSRPWRFVIVRDPGSLRRMARAKNEHSPPSKRETYPADFVADAPVVVAVCVDRDKAPGRTRENGIIAATYVLLAAHVHGLGGVFLTAYQPDDLGLAGDVSAILGLPPEVEPVSLVPLGYPAEQPGPKQPGPVAELVHYETFDGAASA